MARSLRLAVLVLVAAEEVAEAEVRETPLGVSVSLPGGGELVAQVASTSAFRLGVSFEGGASSALPSPSLRPTAPAGFRRVSAGAGAKGLRTSFGALLLAPDGSWALRDTSNGTILRGSAPRYTEDSEGTIQLPVSNSTAIHGGAEPCISNGIFGPPFFWDSEAGFFAFVVSPWSTDPAKSASTSLSRAKQGGSCYPAAFSDADGGFRDPDRDWVNVAQGISSTSDHARPLAPPPPPPPPPPELAARKGWWAAGRAADWYLAPAQEGYAFTRCLYELSGAPAVPPRYAMGFMATYWGYSSMQEVESNMRAMRAQKYPIDSFIMDCESLGNCLLSSPCPPDQRWTHNTCV
eukprot:COSAG04_NODE_144_length_22941_cov_54.823614_15_plen_349_part_00